MKKGFTLIELLAVIAILAVILLIAVPKVIDIVYSSKINAFKINKASVVNAAETYLTNNLNLKPQSVGETIEVLLTDLIADDYIGNINSSFNNGVCVGYVLVTKTANGYIYNPELNCVDNSNVSLATDGLIGFWKLDSKTGLFDLSGNGKHGSTHNGLVIGTAADQHGVSGMGTDFDGFDDYIDFTSIPLTGEFTQVFWLNMDTTGTRMWSGGGTPANVKFGQLDSKYFVRVYTQSDYTIPIIGTGIWHQISLVRKADNTVNLYVNDEEYTLFGGAAQAGESSFGFIARPADTAQCFDGVISEARLYNRALSKEEIKVLYESKK